MPKSKYEPPTKEFKYKIARRLNILCLPKKVILDSGQGMPPLTPRGIRKSALESHGSDRVNDVAWPYTRKLVNTKRMYRQRFTEARLAALDKMIEASNATCYSKLANCVIDLKKPEGKEIKKKRGWSESEWKKHMDYINQIAGPRVLPQPEPIQRGRRAHLEALLPRLRTLCLRAHFKMYRRLSQEDWYRNPEKVQPNALKYKISERVKFLAKHRQLPTDS